MRGAYCWPQSVIPGESISVFFGPNASDLIITITREGKTTTEVLARKGIDSPDQPMSLNVSKEGVDWAPCFEFKVGHDWISGFYLVSVTDADAPVYEDFFIFVTKCYN